MMIICMVNMLKRLSSVYECIGNQRIGSHVIFTLLSYFMRSNDLPGTVKPCEVRLTKINRKKNLFTCIIYTI